MAKNTKKELVVMPPKEPWQDPAHYASPLVLTAFMPIEGSTTESRLRYGDNMSDQMVRTLFDEQHINTLLASLERGSLEYDELKQKLDKSLLIWLAFRSTTESNSRLAQMWADSFTEKSIEIYGMPDQALARDLLGAQIAKLDESSGGVLASLVDVDIEHPKVIVDYAELYKSAAIEVQKYISEKWGDVLERLGVVDTERYDADGIKTAFDNGIEALAETNSAWADWQNELIDGSKVTAVTELKKNVIGRNRAKVSGRKLKQLFVHEVLTHDLEAVNGEATSKQLAYSGLPGYDVAMEGKASFFAEFAFSGGKLPSFMADHYTDIALAMGLIDGRKRNRNEMIKFIKVREQARIDLGESVIKPERLDRFATRRANRYYRGSPADDEASGVFTRDIAYLEGFIGIAEYFKRNREAGQSVDEIMGYLLSGMFDPNNPAHVRYVEAVNRQKQADI
jgi:hypothetical protein